MVLKSPYSQHLLPPHLVTRPLNPYTHRPIYVILAQAAVQRYFTTAPTTDAAAFATYQPGHTPIPWQIVDRYQGKDLIGKTYVQLLPYVTPSAPAFRVIAGDFVTTEEGTGIVHIAPTFGADDQRVAQQAGIPPITVQRGTDTLVPIVDRQGRFVSEITDFAGQYVKAAYAPDEVRQQPTYKPVDVHLAIKLKKENKAFAGPRTKEEQSHIDPARNASEVHTAELLAEVLGADSSKTGPMRDENGNLQKVGV